MSISSFERTILDSTPALTTEAVSRGGVVDVRRTGDLGLIRRPADGRLVRDGEAMLADYAPVPSLAVKNIDQARAFYEGTLGFAPVGDAPDGVMYTAGSGSFLVYPSAFAGSNKATAMSFQVSKDAFDGEVAALRTKGLTFQTFELSGMTWDDGVGTMGDMRSVWFADPDGNILNVGTPMG
jgi:catechol 2,3-dioxygenase-like lactoylglutathione lyase family enzyme